MTTGPSLLQRIQRVAKTVGSIHASGRNSQGRPAISIEDVEDAVRDALAAEGVITVWSDESLESWREPTKQGEMTMWRVRCKVTLFNAEDREDCIEGFAEDIGGTPSGAKSFARKSYYKALFHLASGEDDAAPLRQNSQRPAVPPRAQREVDQSTGEIRETTPANSGNGATGITAPQKRTITALCGAMKEELPPDLESMTHDEAEGMIAALKQRQAAK